jgi:hypothetical protein
MNECLENKNKEEILTLITGRMFLQEEADIIINMIKTRTVAKPDLPIQDLYIPE